MQLWRAEHATGRRRNPGGTVRLRCECCEERRLLSAASAADDTWLLQLRPDFNELFSALVRGSDHWETADADGHFTFRARQGPDRERFDAETSESLSAEIPSLTPGMQFNWSLDSTQFGASDTLPEMSWLDLDTWADLNELLLAGNPCGLQWSLACRMGVVGDPLAGGASAEGWEVMGLIDFGLTVDTAAAFHASLLSVVYPQNSSVPGDRPAVVCVFNVEAAWSSVRQFWEYPLAVDLIQLATNANDAAPVYALLASGFDQTRPILFRPGMADTTDQGTWLGEFPSVGNLPQQRLGPSGLAGSEAGPVSELTEVDLVLSRWSSGDAGGETQETPSPEVIEFSPRSLASELEGENQPQPARDGDAAESDRGNADDPRLETLVDSAEAAELFSPLSREASRLGMQRWKADVVGPELVNPDLVDLSMLAQESLYTTGPASPVVPEQGEPASLAATATPEDALRASRWRSQAFELISPEGSKSWGKWERQGQPPHSPLPVPANPTGHQAAEAPLLDLPERATGWFWQSLRRVGQFVMLLGMGRAWARTASSQTPPAEAEPWQFGGDLLPPRGRGPRRMPKGRRWA